MEPSLLPFDQGYVMHQPFSVFYRSERHTYYVAFKNEETGKYFSAISTKKTNEKDAIRQAWIWYREGIPQKGRVLDLKTYSLRDSIHCAAITQPDAEYIVDELKRRGIVLSCVFAGSPEAVRLNDFIEEFWDWDRSPYIREKLRKDHSIHKNYCWQMMGAIKRFWFPFFPNMLLGNILPHDIEHFIDHLSTIRCTRKEKNKPLSSARKNIIIKAGTIPLRWAHRKGKITQDITRGIMFFSGKSGKRQILTPQIASSIFTHAWEDERSKVANMTAMVTGLRAGELQGLRAGDIGDGCLLVRHSWNPLDKLKPTKNNEDRIVELPFPAVLDSLRYIASINPHGCNEDSYVFWASISANKPMEQRLFLRGLRKSLESTGLSEAEAKGFDFHGWRHFFTTYMRPKIEDKLLQSQTGHKTISMLDRYSEHRRSGDRDKIRDAQVEVFGSLLPSV